MMSGQCVDQIPFLVRAALEPNTTKQRSFGHQNDHDLSCIDHHIALKLATCSPIALTVESFIPFT
jgi:hypothetical protein